MLPWTHIPLPHRGSTASEAAQNIIDVQIPAIHELCVSSSLTVDNIDVFCEKGVFDTDTSCRILKAGKEAGWKLNFHGDELHPMNSGEVWYTSCCYGNNSFCIDQVELRFEVNHTYIV